MKVNNLLRRFRNIVFEPDVPALYGQGLSDYEIIVRIGKALNECIDKINSFNDLAEAMKKALDDIDDYIKEEVIKILHDMYESGELEELLKEIASEYFNNYPVKTSKLELRRVWRECYRVGVNDRIAKAGLRPSTCQSGTVFTYNEHKYFAVGLAGGADYSNTGGSQSYSVPSAGVLQIYDYEDEQSINVVGQICFNAGHFECMDFNEADGYFYIGHGNFGTGLQSDRITRIHITNILGHNADVSDFCDLPFISDENTMIEKMYLNITQHYPYNETQWLGSLSCTTGEANKFYAGQGARLWLYEWDNETPIELITNNQLIEDIELGIVQNNNINAPSGQTMAYANMTVTEKYIFYSFTRPNCIIRVDRTLQKIDWIYYIPRLVNNDMLVFGEQEGLKVFENGDVYLFTYTNIQNAGELGSFGTSQLRMAQLFKQNLYTNIAVPFAPQYYQYNTHTIYVDAENKNYNPTGFNNMPFNNILEALFFAETQPLYKSIRIMLNNRSNPYFLIVCTDKSIQIQSNAYVNGTLVLASVGGLQIRSCPNFQIDNCYVYYSLQSVSNNNAYIAAYNSKLTINRTAIAGNAQNIGVNIALFSRGSTVLFSAANSSAEEPPLPARVYWNKTDFEAGVTDGQFISADYSCILSSGKSTTGTYVLT